MTLPTFSSEKHDCGLQLPDGDIIGFMRPGGAEALITRTDATPATSRSAMGEGRYDTFQSESFFAQADLGGGAGQPRMLNSDQFLQGIVNSKFGDAFPPYKKIDISAGTGGTTGWMFAVDGTAYGLNGSAITKFGTNTTFGAVGSSTCKPVVSTNNFAFFVNGGNVIRWKGEASSESGSTATCTPVGMTAGLVALYNRFLWVFGTRTIPFDIAMTQSLTTTFEGGTGGLGWDDPTIPGSLLLMFVATTYGDSVTVDVPDGWTRLGHKNQADILKVAVYAIESADSRSGIESITVSEPDARGVIGLMEVAGMSLQSVVDVMVSASDVSPDTTIATGATGTREQSKELVISWAAIDQSTTHTPAGGWTEQWDVNASGGGVNLSATLIYKETNNTSSETPTTTAGTGGNWAGITLALRGNALTTDLTQLAVAFSEDEGHTWREAFDVYGAGLPVPTAAVAAGGALWLGTPVGLWEMRAQEDVNPATGKWRLDVVIRGKMLEWSRPSSGGAGGRMAVYDNAVYIRVGATVWRHPMGAAPMTGRPIWPSHEWSTTAGAVQDLISWEDGIYFGAAGFLWAYDGRGFHPIAAEPAANAFDYLLPHAGRMYLKANPADYFEIGFPGQRPDITTTAPTNFDTTYVVYSKWDADKPTVVKLIRSFDVHARWSATTNSGTISLYYLKGCLGLEDPGRTGGGATSLDWQLIGTMTVADGGTKHFTLPEVLRCHTLYVRVKAEVGATGFAIPQVVTAYGRSIMPPVRRFQLPLSMVANGTVDKDKQPLYLTDDDVQEAVDYLWSLRDTETEINLYLVDKHGHTTDYITTSEMLMDNLLAIKQGSYGAASVSLQLLEVPG